MEEEKVEVEVFDDEAHVETLAKVFYEAKEKVEKAAVTLEQEPEKEKKLSATEKVIEDLNQNIEKAEEAGSYFVTITRKEGDKLKHWMGSIRFPQDDRAHSLRELLRMVPSKGTKGNVRKFGPRKHGG